MLAKLIVWHGTRELTIARMQRALGEYFIGGIDANLRLFRTILEDEAFRAGNLDTGYLDRLLRDRPIGEEAPPRELAQIAALAIAESIRKETQAPVVPVAPSRWLSEGRASLLR